MALGGQKDWPVREDAPLEVVPVDMVAAAAILTVAALLLEGRQEQVYQLGSADVNPVDLGSIVRWLDGEARRRKNGNSSYGRALIDWLAGARRGASVRFVNEEEAEARRAKREASAARLERRVAALAGMIEKTGLKETLAAGLAASCGSLACSLNSVIRLSASTFPLCFRTAMFLKARIFAPRILRFPKPTGNCCRGALKRSTGKIIGFETRLGGLRSGCSPRRCGIGRLRYEGLGLSGQLRFFLLRITYYSDTFLCSGAL